MKKFRRFIRSVFLPVERHRHIYRADWRTFIRPLFWIILFMMTILGLSLLLSVEASDIVASESSQNNNLLWAVVCQFADPGNLHMASTKGAIIAFVCAFGGIFCLSGLFVSSLVSYNAHRAERWRNGFIRYNGWYNRMFFNNYIVIIGVNGQTATITKRSLRRADVRYVLIQTKNEVEKERLKLELKLSRIDEERVVFYSGDRTLYEDIVDLGLERAKEVFILGEDMNREDEQDHDSFNMKCLELISRYCHQLPKDRHRCWTGEKLRCHVNFEYQSTYTIFKSTHIYKQLNENVEFLPFNIQEIWAKKVLVDNYAVIPGGKTNEYAVQRYLPLDCFQSGKNGQYVGISCDSDMSVHLFVVGMNQMGVALALQAALLIHLPNFITKGYRTTISFIDEHATRESEFLTERLAALFELSRHRTIKCSEVRKIRPFEEERPEDVDPMKDTQSRYQHLGDNFMDIQWEFIEGNVASKTVLDYMIETAANPRKTCSVAVCLDKPSKSMAAALYLPEKLMKNVLQVLVYQKNSFDLIQKVATGETEWKRYEKLRPFGMQEDCYKGTMFDNILAKLALTVYSKGNLQYSKNNIDFFIKYVNDLWSEEGIVNKLSNINLADSFPSKLRSVGLSTLSAKEECNKVLNQERLIELLEQTEHNRWVTERLTLGYRPLDKNEMQYFLLCDNQDERKTRKEYYKSKYRAHLDICSYEMLRKVDNTLINDKRIVHNLLRLRFQRRESEIRCRQILAKGNATDGNAKKRNVCLRVLDKLFYNPTKTLNETYRYIQHMATVKEGRLAPLTGANTGTRKIHAVWMGAYPVTQGLWKEVMGKGNNPSHNKGDRHPVEMVSKEDIEDFLTILNDRTGLHFTLPSKNEWLYAALAGHPASYYKMGNRAERMAWFSSTASHQVCKKEKNDFGLFDMLGNVWEWTRTEADSAGDSFYFLGGSWKYNATECDLTDSRQRWCRHWHADYKSADLGFRLMLPYPFDKDDSMVKQQETERYRIFNQILKQLKEVPAANPGTSHMAAFWMADAPVTQRQWSAFMGNNPSEHKGRDLPVDNVSFLDAMAFVRKINRFFQQEFHMQLKDEDLFCLPTHSQWVHAAKGGTMEADKAETAGDSGQSHQSPDGVAWHLSIAKGTHQVRTKRPNAFGLYDMLGNVWEWCTDRGTTDITRILKGGSWRSEVQECDISASCDWPQDHAGNDIGFRLVLSNRAATACGLPRLHQANQPSFQ